MKNITRYLIIVTGILSLTSFIHQWGTPPSDLKIVYNVMVDKTCSTYEVFTMNPDGTEKKNISNWKGADWAYATFDNKIYFVSDRDSTARLWFLYEMDVDGQHVRRISDISLQDSYVGIHGSGKEVLVAPNGKSRNLFFVLDIKSGRVLDTIVVPLLYVAHAIYLPGDTQIVFCGQKDKKTTEELYIMNTDGTGLKQITNYPKNDTTARWYETHAGNPVWNNQQKCISYFSKQNGNHSIFTVKPDGSGYKKLTDDSFNEGWHAWSPDGKWIVYDGSDAEDKNSDIYLMRSDGSDVRRLTTDTLVEQAPLFITCKKNNE